MNLIRGITKKGKSSQINMVYITIYCMSFYVGGCEFEPAWDRHRRRFFRGCLIERSELRSSNGSFKYNQDLDRMTLIDNSAISTEEAILGKYK